MPSRKGLRMRFLSLFPFVLVAACSGSTLDGGKTSDAGASDAASAADGADAPSTSGAICTTDAECNDDATQNRLSGKCEAGRCKCLSGDHLVPGGRCRAAAGVGASCAKTEDCYAGLECLDFAVHPKDAPCQVVGKQCTASCNATDQRSVCTDVFGPGVLCFAGCTGTQGICGLTP